MAESLATAVPCSNVGSRKIPSEMVVCIRRLSERVVSSCCLWPNIRGAREAKRKAVKPKGAGTYCF